jgi:hypothetical protein
VKEMDKGTDKEMDNDKDKEMDNDSTPPKKKKIRRGINRGKLGRPRKGTRERRSGSVRAGARPVQMGVVVRAAQDGEYGDAPIQRRTIPHDIQRYHVRARFEGVLEFICPFCGCLTTVRMLRGQFRVQCAYTQCFARFVVKMGLLKTKNTANALMPGDYVIPDSEGPLQLAEAFPLGEFEAWRRAGCVHAYLGPETGSSAHVDTEQLVYRAKRDFVLGVRAAVDAGCSWEEAFKGTAKREWIW